MEAVAEKLSTLQEYLEMEYDAPRRHYFFQGKIAPMGYTSEEHGLIIANLLREIGVCIKHTEIKAYPSDRMLYVPACELNYYPDVMLVKGDPVFHQHTPRMKVTLNPFAIIEVLSDSTETIDRNAKWNCYRQIPSLQQYFLVSQNRVFVEFFNRLDERRWENSYVDQRSQSLEVAGFELPLEDLYLNVNFPA